MWSSHIVQHCDNYNILTRSLGPWWSYIIAIYQDALSALTVTLKHGNHKGVSWVFQSRYVDEYANRSKRDLSIRETDRYSGPTRFYYIIKFANVWLGHGVVISWERVNMFVGDEDELGILDTDDQTSDKQSTVWQRDQDSTLMVQTMKSIRWNHKGHQGL